ncbi:MAG: hypothetical protein CL583_12565 [Alteromonadaceae bacterium]|nr:hypothetical protein [Alteromonadaceae bacterium]
MLTMCMNGSRIIFTLMVLMGSSAVFAELRCPVTPIPAYTGDLNIQSGYDPEDPTRSTRIDDPDSRSKAINDYLIRFSDGLGRFADYYASRQTDAKAGSLAIQCTHEWLASWAREHALTTTDASPTGVALRVWTLSAVATAVLKMEHYAGADWALTAAEKTWIAKLGEIVRADYADRIRLKPERINNHDYWAAWAVAASAIVTEQEQALSWSYTVFRFAMSQTVNDDITYTAYLPNELGRGALGAHYTQFALTPLVMLADHLPDHGYVIDYRDTVQLKKLAEFAAIIVLTPEAVFHIQDDAQRIPSPASFTWLYPFNALYADVVSTQELLEIVRPYTGVNYRLGGDLRPLYD